MEAIKGICEENDLALVTCLYIDYFERNKLFKTQH